MSCDSMTTPVYYLKVMRQRFPVRKRRQPKLQKPTSEMTSPERLAISHCIGTTSDLLDSCRPSYLLGSSLSTSSATVSVVSVPSQPLTDALAIYSERRTLLTTSRNLAELVDECRRRSDWALYERVSCPCSAGCHRDGRLCLVRYEKAKPPPPQLPLDTDKSDPGLY